MISAVGGRAHYIDLIVNLTARDIKTRYKQSLLGYAWAMLFPLATALVYTLVGSVILRARTGGLDFPLYSYFGLLYWNLFAAGITAATESLVAHLSLITKVYFPREVFPIAAVLSKTVDFGFGLVGLLPLLLWFHTAPRLAGLPLALGAGAILLVYATGLGLLLSCANLFYRDVRHVVGIALSLGMFLVPNIYPVTQVPPAWRTLYLLNPVAALTEVSRRALFPQSGRLSALDPATGGSLWPFVAAAALTAAGTLLAGFLVFKRLEPRFAESV